MLKGRTILQIIPTLESGGAERTTVDIAGALTEAGANSLVASSYGRMVEQILQGGSEFIEAPANSKQPLKLIQLGRQLNTLARSRSVDLIHARSRAPAWPAFMVARLQGLPFVTTYHGIYSQSNAAKAFYNSVMARGDIVIANSEYTKNIITRRHGFAKDRVRVVYRGTDIEAFSKSNISQTRKLKLLSAWNLSQAQLARPIIINVARISPWKGHSVLIEAARAIKASGSLMPLFIIIGGAGRNDQLAQSLRLQISSAGLTGDVLMVGHCDDVAAAHALAKLAVVSSTREEAFGRAAVEAAAAGLPVIATDHGGARETVLPITDSEMTNGSGWLVKPGDAAALASALSTFLAMDKSALKQIGQNGRAYASTNFGLDRMKQKTLQIYDELISVKPS